jgi:hypothetical protein
MHASDDVTADVTGGRSLHVISGHFGCVQACAHRKLTHSPQAYAHTAGSHRTLTHTLYARFTHAAACGTLQYGCRSRLHEVTAACLHEVTGGSLWVSVTQHAHAWVSWQRTSDVTAAARTHDAYRSGTKADPRADAALNVHACAQLA